MSDEGGPCKHITGKLKDDSGRKLYSVSSLYSTGFRCKNITKSSIDYSLYQRGIA